MLLNSLIERRIKRQGLVTRVLIDISCNPKDYQYYKTTYIIYPSSKLFTKKNILNFIYNEIISNVKATRGMLFVRGNFFAFVVDDDTPVWVTPFNRNFYILYRLRSRYKKEFMDKMLYNFNVLKVSYWRTRRVNKWNANP